MNSDGTRIAIGAPYNDGNESTDTRRGHVRVYDYSNGSWSQVGSDIDGEAADDTSGYSVVMNSDGTRIAIGATQNDGNDSTDSRRGHVRVYEWNNSTSLWDKLGDDIDGEATNDNSGYSVAMNSSGNRIAIGAPFNDGNDSSSGHVRVYDYSNGSWT